ncbi:putative protein of unknown function (DUF4456) [Trypanosoma vivax]|nr:hypothetical protein TRVL_01983 [Trypanosoma vivax]KAH8612563.1 putative protein of unknown function (DUF4456) [Trypanosoma vivax]
MSSLQLPATDGASRLLLRLANRQQQALSAFQDSVRKFNKQLDEQQTQQLVLLQGFLQQSHKDTSRLLQEELTRVEDHQQQLTRYAETHNDNPKEGIVLEPFTDRYHTEEAHFNGGAASMQADRQRLIEMAITLQDSYEARVKAIDKCNDAMNASEEQRCVWMKRALFDLVVALAQIGYTGVSASQVMAQRVIHATNESLCRNHAAYKSLLLQLKSREILSQRMYCRQMAEIYDRVMQLMASSSIAWAVTLLQTAHFRRPDFRHLLLQRVSGIVSDMRHDGSEFLQNIGFTLQSLQRSRDPLPTECGQICGGTTHDGWLRGFDGNLFSPVFVPSAPGDVAAEWRVKANILVRHAVAQSSKLLQELRKAEENLRDTVENVQAQLQHILHWLCETDKPVNETSAWAKASMYEVDSVYLPFTKPNAARLNKYMEEVGTRLHPLSQIIHAESEWFVSVVDDALNRSYTSLECLLLTDHRSVLYTFDHATSALSNTVTGALGFIRDRLVVQYEAHKDHEDEVRFVEEELARAQQRIRSAETEEEAEKMFTHGLKTLEQLSNLYKTFHRDRVKSLQQLEEEGVAETEKQCTVLLRLFGLESEEVCLRRLEEERAAAAAAIAASATKSRGKETKEIVETDEEIDDVDLSVYPTVIADDGTPYLIVSPLMLGAESVVEGASDQLSKQGQSLPKSPLRGNEKQSKGRSYKGESRSGHKVRQSSGGKKSRSTRGTRSHVSNDSPASLVVPVVVPPPLFIQVYGALLRKALQEDDASSVRDQLDRVANASIGTSLSEANSTISKTKFFSAAAVDEWREMLRMEVLNWTVNLRRTTTAYLKQHRVDKKAEVDAETNNVLRHHRRRPAALQADVYELRLRELECSVDTAETHMTRMNHLLTSAQDVCNALISSGGNVDVVVGVGSASGEMSCSVASPSISGSFTANIGVASGNAPSETSDARLLAQLQKLSEMANVATSVDALLTQERTFMRLIASSQEQHTTSYTNIMGGLIRKQKVLQSECRRYLRCFGIAVPDDLEKLKKMYVEGIENEDEDEDGTNGGKKRGAATHKKDKKQGGKNAKKKANQKKAKQADGTEKESGKGENGQKEGDPDSEQNVLMRVAAMLWSVDDGIVQAKKALDANLEQHIRQLEELKNTYNTTFKQNVGELQMLANLQDISARFKAHVHSALALCDTNEAKLLGMLTELEEKLKAAPEVYDFSNLRRITSREHVEKAAMATPAGRSFAPSPSNDCVNDSISKDANAAAFSEDRLHMAEAELRERLADAMVEVQHEVRTSEAAHILRLLDKIRTAFYVRGRTLDCMQYGVEFLSIPQENYVEPRTTSPNEGTIDEMISSRGCPTPSTSRPSRRSRVSNAQPPENTSPYSTIELPAVVTLETQVRELMESAMSCACTLVEQHFASFPSPMRSRAPGMFSGTAEEITQAFDQLCEQQLQRTQQHLKQATRRYREHVQRLATAIKKVPNRVAASTFSLSCVALEKRVSAVLDVFARLYGESMSLRNMYENLVKATFASNRNRKRLNQVCTAEEVRQSVTQEVIDRFWKLSMREMEEETNMHLARSLNVKDCFFALLRGLVGPDHLKVQENDVSHRGLRRLMQLKAKEAREKELQQQVSPRRERRLRETMQRQRHSEGSAEGGDGKKGEGPLDTTKGILPLLVQRESEQGSVCVSNFHPIDQGHLRCSPTFNMRPTNNHHSQGSQLAFSLPRRHSRVTGCEQQQQASPKTTITISGPTTAAHKETAKVTLQSIDAFGRNITEAAEKMNDAFLEWLEREQVWKSTWEAAIGIFDA